MLSESQLRLLTEKFLAIASVYEKSNQSLDFGTGAIVENTIDELRQVVRWHNDLYYRHEKPEISDVEYDRLFKLLASAEQQYLHQIRPDSTSPTARIDVALGQQFQKGLHKVPMISLDNTYNEEELADFDGRLKRTAGLDATTKIAYAMELKFDGLGLSLTYRNGELVRALTRGNGIEGEDVTANALQIRSIPHRISLMEELEIRGEVIMPTRAFEDLNRERLASGEKVFSNPRNAASGSLRQLDVSVTKSRNLWFFAYSVPVFEKTEWRERVPTYTRCLEVLCKNGFSTTPYYKIQPDISAVIAEIRGFAGTKPTFDFDIDGLVIKADSFDLWSAAGSTEHHPRHSTAYKFPATQVRTRILSVEHSVGRTGAVTPVANLEPVNVGGVLVKRATLHNYDEAFAKDIRIGDMIFLRRAGEVIPEVVAPIPEMRTGNETPLLAPSVCPACGTKLIREGADVVWRCPNREDCPAQGARSLEWFVGKNAMDIDGLGKKQLARFRELGWIRDLPSLYRLKNYRDQILALEGYQEKSVENLLLAIEASRKAPVARVLAALGIPGVGKKTGKTLARFFRSKEDFRDFKLTQEQLETVRDIGPETAISVVEFFQQNAPMIRDLMTELEPEFSVTSTSWTGLAPVIPASEPGSSVFANPSDPSMSFPSGPLSGTTFCITGSFERYSRDQLVELGEKAGGEFRDSVSKKLGFLVVGTDAGSKLKKAEELGVKTVTLPEFLAMVS